SEAAPSLGRAGRGARPRPRFAVCARLVARDVPLHAKPASEGRRLGGNGPFARGPRALCRRLFAKKNSVARGGPSRKKLETGTGIEPAARVAGFRPFEAQDGI